jgi:hydrogenase maturation protease
MTNVTDSSQNVMANPPSILIAGIGNIFLGDDAFGSEVARRLEPLCWPAGVRAVDFGIRGLDLAYALLDGHDLTILIDATPRGGPPGTLYVIEPDLSGLEGEAQGTDLLDAHTLNPLKILGLARVLGGTWKRLLLVGCEPGDLGGDEGRLGLTDAVRVAVDEAVGLVSKLVHEFLESGSLDGGFTCGSAAPATNETVAHDTLLAKEPSNGGS